MNKRVKSSRTRRIFSSYVPRDENCERLAMCSSYRNVLRFNPPSISWAFSHIFRRGFSVVSSRFCGGVARDTSHVPTLQEFPTLQPLVTSSTKTHPPKLCARPIGISYASTPSSIQRKNPSGKHLAPSS